MTCWKLFGTCCLAGLLAASAPLATAAQPVADSLLLTLEDVLARGVANSVQLQTDAKEEQAAAEQRRTARMERLPDVEVSLSGGAIGQPVVFSRGLAHPTRPDTPDWSQHYGIDVSQPLYQGGRVRGAVRGADLAYKAAQLRTLDHTATVKLDLVSRYVDLFRLYKQIAVLERNIEEAERRLADIRRLRREGIVTNNDVLRSELQLTNDRLALDETRNSLSLAAQQLDILLGLDERTVLIPDTALLNRTLPLDDYEDYVAEAFVAEPSLRLARKQTEMAHNDVELARANYRPTLSLTAGNTLARPVQRTMADLYNNTWNVGLNFSYPLSALYKNRSRVRAARASEDASRKREEQREQNLRVEIRAAYLRHHEARKRVEALRLSVEQANENYRIVQNRYFAQLAILTDLLDANAVRLEAELQLTSARADVIYTYYQLQRACGRL